MQNLYMPFILTNIIILLPVCSATASDLATRYSKLACAVVEIRTDNEKGTGFFVNGSGRLITAAHVGLDRTAIPIGSGFMPSISTKVGLKVVNKNQLTLVPKQSFSEAEIENSNHDIAVLETGIESPCFLTVGDAGSAKVGDNVISLGYPVSSPKGVLYSGFVASIETRVHEFGPVLNHPEQVAQTSFDTFRVQMPITPGSSGAPLIDDQDKVIGVVIETPVLITGNIKRLISSYIKGESGGLLVNGFDISNLIAELGYTVQEFESPGAGLAVPLPEKLSQ